jgi:hypothetical protein
MSRVEDDYSYNAVANPQQWKLPDPNRVIAALRLNKQKNEMGDSKGSRWTFSRDIIPVDFYAYLMNRFGPPNGFAMTLRSPSVDNLIHWNYTLECENSIIDIHALDTQIDIHAYATTLDDSGWWTLESNLLTEFKHNQKALASVKKEFEKWHLFVNPYRRLAAIVDRFERRLNQIAIPKVESPSIPVTEEQMRRFTTDMEHALDLQQEAMALCVSIEMVAPVMGEAAVNLVMLLLAKSELRDDKRLMEKFSRDQIDVRIKSLHLHCDGFANPVSASDERFKEFLRVMNRRNDALHGNIDPKRDFGEILYFDQRSIPLPTAQHSLSEIAIQHMMADLSKERSLSSINAIHGFVELLLECLECDKRSIVRRVMEEQLLGRESKTGRIGVILPIAKVAIHPQGE